MDKESYRKWCYLINGSTFLKSYENFRIKNIILIGSIVQLPMLFFNLSEADSFRFAQTTLVVKEFMINGFDPRTPLPIFGSKSYVPFEFPLFQGIAGVLGNCLHISPLVATRLTALIFFQITAFFLFEFSKEFFNYRIAMVAAILFEFTPFGLRFAHSPLIEFGPLALILISIFLSSKFIKTISFLPKLVYFIAGTITLDFAFLMKVTSAIALTPLLLFPFISFSDKKKSRRLWRLESSAFLIFGLFTALSLVVEWNRYADKMKSLNPISSYLISSTPQMRAWNIGSLKDRLSLKTMETILLQYMGPMFGGIFVLMFLLAFALKGSFKLRIGMLLASLFIPILAFTNLYKNHEYYVSAIYPAGIILASIGIVSFCEYLNPRNLRFSIFSIAMVFILFCADTRYGINYLADIVNHAKPPALAADLRKLVPKGEEVMYLGCDWNPEIPFYVERPTLMIPEWNIKPNPLDLRAVKYVAFCNFSAEMQISKFLKYFPSPSKYIRIDPNILKID